MPRLGRRWLGLVFGALLLFTIGTNVEAGWLLVLASLSLGAAVAGMIIPPLMLRGVLVQRRAPAKVFQGDEVNVELVVQGSGRGLRMSLAIEDPNLSPARVFVPALRPGELIALVTRRRATRRGFAESQPIVLSSAAPFGVARASRKLTVGGSTMVYPRVVAVPDLSLLEFSAGDGGSTLVARRGGAQDYLGVREYRLGDSMRHVHWPSTARVGTLMVREFERDQCARLCIAVDTSADQGTEDTPLDLCCAVAASVTVAAMEAGHPVTLVAATREGTELVSPAQPSEALRWLAGLQAVPGRPLAHTLAETGASTDGWDALLVALPTWASNGLEAVSAGLGGIGTQGTAWTRVAVALVDPTDFRPARRSPILSGDEVRRLEIGLRARGVDAIRIGKWEELEQCLVRLLSFA